MGLILRDLPSVSALVDEEYSMVFRDGQSLLYSEGVTLDAADSIKVNLVGGQI